MASSTASLQLQRALYQRQRARIRKSVIGGSPAFSRYENRYRHATRTFSRTCSLDEVRDATRSSDIVYVGDYHTLKRAQTGYIELVKCAIQSKRRVVMALELVQARHQPALDLFLAGGLSEEQFLIEIEHPYRGAFDIWPHFAPILRLAKERSLKVIAIDKRSKSKNSLEQRDTFAGKLIAQESQADDRPLIMVLMGQFHVAPKHLPAQTARALNSTQRKHLVIYQNAEGIYWELAKRGLAASTEAVHIGANQMAVVSASPVVCQQSFLDYIEAEQGDLPIEESTAASTFRDFATALGKELNIEVTGALKNVEVITAGDLRFFDRLRTRGRFSAPELRKLRRHVLSRESAYIPQAQMAYLASFSLNHAAEEATHFVRHCAVGAAMAEPRGRIDAFFGACLEEALGFFGSRLLNPKRRCTQMSEWSTLFRYGPRSQRDISAFVMAIKAAELKGIRSTPRLVPTGDEELFQAVSHALGYLLGEALAAAFEEGRVTRREIRKLFFDPFTDPAGRYFEWVQKVAG